MYVYMIIYKGITNCQQLEIWEAIVLMLKEKDKVHLIGYQYIILPFDGSLHFSCGIYIFIK